jgi:NAD(P)-dependent dehydrogenase (short-subunit alcohol dehydrogenase family)
MKSAVITGASTGIGWAAAKLLLEPAVRYPIMPDPMRQLVL